MMLPRSLFIPLTLALAGCATVQPAPVAQQHHGFTAEQASVLRANGFVEKGDDWEFGLADRLLFATDESDLIPGQRDRLKHLAGTLAKVGLAGARVEGHTDVTGTAAYNEALSLRRAQSVADALTEGGMDHERLKVRGLGKADPVQSNATAAGRRENRRVVIIVSPPDAPAE